MTSLVYSTGTVSVSNASAVVTGTGTAWALALVTGGMFSFAGMSVPILSVESDTSLTLAYPWPGTTAGGAYAIARETSEAVRAAWINDRLAQILTKLALVGIHPDGAGTLAERNALSPVPAAGYLWLRVEVGFDLGFYKKTASGWDGPFAVRGDVGPAGPIGPIGPDGDITWESAWVTATAYTVNQAVSRNGSSYVCIANHTSGAANEPGVGASWATVWDLLAAKGAQGDPGAGVSDGDKGDVVVASGVWSIDNNVVTYAKMQDVSATARVLGRKTAGAGDPEELTISDVLNMVGSAAEGDILYRSASGWTRLPKGTVGQYLKQNTALTAPEWVTVVQREVLTANRTYYVRTDGSDSNNGLANTAGGAFLTIQKAFDTVSALDCSIYSVIIQAGDGARTTGASFRGHLGSGTVTLRGNLTTPANCSITATNTHCINVSNNGRLYIGGFKLSTVSWGNCLNVEAGSTLQFNGAMDFGVAVSGHMSTSGGIIEGRSNYTISGGSQRHVASSAGGMIDLQNLTVTLTGTPAWSIEFAYFSMHGRISMYAVTYSGAATGKRYSGDTTAIIQTFGAGTASTYFPGNSNGTVSTGAQQA
jgi:hypothetical protein